MRPDENSLDTGYGGSERDASLESPSAPVQPVIVDNQVAPKRYNLSPFRYNRTAFLITGMAIAVITLIAAGSVLLGSRHNSASVKKSSGLRPGAYSVTNLALGDLSNGLRLKVGPADKLDVNGQLQISNTVVLKPTAMPDTPVAGQIYYDQATNAPYYYNGTRFISLAPAAAPQSVTSLGGTSGVISLGDGLQVSGNQLSVSSSLLQSVSGLANAPRVTSLQGLTGDVALNAGTGIGINGTTISNKGVVGLAGGSGITITNDGNGNYTVSAAGSGSVVNSLTGTPNQINVSSSTGNVTLSLPQDIAASSTPTFSGIVLTGGGLGVPSGGTGASSFTANGILYGNGSGALQATASAANSVLVTNGSSVPGLSQTLPFQVQGNITETGTLNSGSITAGFGAISIVNNITTTALIQGGSLEITGGNFTVDASGNIVTTGTAAVQGSGGLIVGVQGSTAGSITFYNASNSHTTSLQALAPAGQNQTITIPVSTVVSDQVCLLTLGNCVGSGGAVTATGGTQNYIPKFNNAAGNDLGNSLLFDNGVSVGIGTNLPGASYLLDINGNLHAVGSATIDSGLTITAGGASITGNVVQNGTGTFSTGTGAVSLNGDTSVTGSHTLTVGSGATNLGGTLGVTGLASLGGGVSIASGATITGTTNINISGTANTSIGNATGTFNLISSGLNVSTAGALSGITGYNQASGNFAQSGGGTFSTGSGAVSLNGATTVSSTLAVQGSGGLTIGVSGPSGTAGVLNLANSTNANLGSLQTAVLGQNTTYTLPDPGAATANICLDTGNCAGVGGGITGSGTANTLALFTGSGTIGNSILTQSGTTVTVGGTLSATALQGDGSGITSLNGTQVTSGTVANARLVNGGALAVTAGAGLSGGGSVALGSSTSLAVTYGSGANTAVQGNVTLTCASGTGNLSGGGNTVTLGSGGSCSNISITNSPTFSGNLTVQGASGITVGVAGSTAGVLNLANASNTNLSALNAAAPTGTGNATYTLPSLAGGSSANICLDTGNCASAGAAGGDLTGSYPNPTIAKLQGTTLTLSSLASGDILQYNGSAIVNNAVSGDITINGSGVTTIGNGKVTNAKLANSSLTVTAGNGLSGGGSVSLGGSTSLAVAYGSAANTAVQGNVTLTCASGTGNLSGGGNTVTLGSGGSCSNISITNSPTFSGNLTVQGSSGITIGVAGVSGTAGVLNLADGSTNFLGSLKVATLGQNTTYTLPDPGAATANICLSTGNCAGSGGGITGSGTSGNIAKFNGSGSITNSGLSESGTTLTYGGNVAIQGSSSLSLGTSGSLNGSIAFYNGSGTHTVTLQAPSSDPASNLVFKLPSSYGSSGYCLQSDGAGGLSFNACTGGGAGGVTSLDAQTGVLTLNNSSGSGGAITIDNASTTAKGIAQFNSTNFTASSGTINTVQDIATSSSPTFAGLTLSSALTVANGGTGTGSFTANGILYGNGTGALQVTSAAANSILATNGSNVPSLTQTLPTAVQGNITGVGTLTGGLNIASGQTYKINNIDINTAGTLSNVAYLNQANAFTNTNSINVNSSTALKVEQTGVKNNVLVVDTTNGLIGINQTPSSSGTALQVSGSITASGNVLANNALQFNTSSTTSGYLKKTTVVGTGGANNNDVVIMDSSAHTVQTSTARDTRVYGVIECTGSCTNGSSAPVAIAGNHSVNADATTTPINVGDQLVTSTNPGYVVADNNATTGILGHALTALASGTGSVGVAINVVAGQSTPVFRSASNSTTAFQVQDAINGYQVLTVDTTGAQVVLGKAGTTAGKLVLATTGSSVTLQSATQANAVALSIPADTNLTDTICLFTLSNCSATGTAGGDLTGSYPNPTIAKLQGTTLTISSIASGDVLQYNGSAIVNGHITNSNLTAGSFSNITGTGALASGSIASGFGTISTGNNITTTATIQGGIVNATSTLELNGTDINTAGTLSNVAYLNAASQSFTGKNTFSRNGTATGDYSFGVTGTPINDATSSLIRIGNAISGGNAAANGGTYIGLNAPSTLAGSTADFLNFQLGGASKLKVDNSGNITASGTFNTATISGGTLSGGSISGGTLTASAVNGLSVSGGTITNPTITGTVTGSSSPTITGFGTYNGQTISSTANFTGTVAIQGANALTLGTTGTNTGAIVFNGATAASGTITLQGPSNPSTSNYTLSIPALTANANICTDNSVCSGYAPSTGGNYIAKNAADTSSASFAGNLLGLTNTNTGAAGVMSLTNSGTNSALSILQSGTSEPSAGQALILANNNTTTPTGNLLDLQNKNTSEFHVDVSGNTTALGLATSVGLNAQNGLIQGAAGLTVTGAAVSLNASSNNDTNINTGTSTGNVNIGNGSAGAIVLQSGSTIGLTAGTINLTGGVTVSSTLAVQGSGGITVGVAGGTAGLIKLANGSNTNLSVISAAAPSGTGNATYTLPSIAGTTSDTICLATLSNCTAIGTAGGDLTGSYPNPTIAKLQGTTLTISSIASGDVLQYNGSAIVNGHITNSNLTAGSFSNITGTGALASGSIASGFGTISTGNNITTTATIQGGIVNATSTLELNGTDINTAGTLSNVAYLNQANAFTNTNSINTNSATALKVEQTGVNNNTLVVDTSSGRVGLGATPANGILTVGTNTTAASGGIYFGTDTTLYRSTNNTLTTGGNFITGGTINSQTISSTANFTGTVTIQGGNALTLGTTGTSTGAILFKGVTAASGTLTLIGPANPSTNTLTLPNETGTLCSTGSVCTGYAPSSGSANYIQNGTTVQASSNFHISGDGTADTSFTTPLLQAPASTALTITGNAASVWSTSAGSLQIKGGSTLTLNSTGASTLTIDSGSTGAINIGNNANGKAITLGNSTGGTSIALNCGTGVCSLGSNATDHSVNVGSTTGVSVTSIKGGTGGINIGTANVSQTIQLGDTADAVAQTINIGNNATSGSTDTIAIGNLLSTSSTTIQGGTGASAISLQAGTSGTISIGTTNVNTVTVGSTANTGTLTFGQSTAGETVNVANGTVATGNTNNVNIGTNATGTGKDVVTIGSGNGASSVTLQAGSAGVTVKSGSSNNSMTAFQVQNGSSAALFTADTTNMRLGVNVTYSAMSAPGTLTMGTASGGSLTAATTYFYKVTAIDSAGGETAPSPENSIATTSSNKTITVSWTAVSGASGYRVYRGTSTGAETGYYATINNSFTDTGATQDNTTATPPSSGTAYVSTNVTNSSLQLSIGGNGTPTGQLYISGSLPSAATGSVAGAVVGDAVSIYVQGRYLYEVTSSNLKIIDVSNPGNPTVIGSTSVASNSFNVYVQGRYAYVGSTNSTSSLQIFDVSNPASPTSVSAVNVNGGASRPYVQGRYAYLIGNNSLNIVDVSNPASPVQVGSVTATSASQAYVQGRYAYVIAGANLLVFDVSNPASPTSVGSLAATGTMTSIYVQGRYVYTTASTSNVVQIFDVSNPASPVRLSSTSLGSFPQAIFVQGRYAYMADRTASNFRVIDISNPYKPFSVGTVTTNNTTWSIYVQGRYAYVGTSTGIQAFDMGGTYSQQFEAGGAEVGTLQVDSNAQFNGNASIQGGLSIGSSTDIGGNLGVAGTAFVQGTLSVAGGVQGGLSVSGISTPGAPTITSVGGNASSTNWSYTVTAVSASGGETVASSAGSISASDNATLNSSNYNQITWTSVTGAVSYKVYRTVAGGTPSTTGLIGTTSATFLNDTGLAASGSSPTVNTTGNFSVTGNATFKPITDNTAAFQIQNATGGEIFTVDTTNSKVGTANQTANSTNSTSLTIKTGDASGITSNSGSLTIDTGTATGTAGNISIGTGAYAHNVTVGNTTGTSATTIQGGTGASAVGVQAGTSGTISIGTTNVNTVTVGSTANTGTLTFGQSTAGETVNIGNGTVAASNTNNINIGTSSTSTGKDTVTIGSTNGSSSTTIQGGTGASAIGLQVGASGTISVGTTLQATTLTLGNTNSSTTASITTGATSLSMANGGVTLQTTSASSSALNVKNSSNWAVFNVDTNLNETSIIGTATGANPGTVELYVESNSDTTIRGKKIGAGGDLLELANNSSDVLDVSSAGNITAAGTYNTNTFTSSALQFGAAATASVDSASSQALQVGTSNATTLTLGRSGGTTAINGGSSSTISFTNFGVSNAGVVTLQGAQTADLTTAAASTANGLTVQPGTSSAATGTGAGVTIAAGSQSGTTTSTGGTLTLQGGSATGASGTRTGGNVSIDAGTGATANGSILIGNTNAVSITVGNTTGASSLTLQAGSGGTTVKTTSTTAFVIQSTTPTTLFTADTSAMKITISGTTSTFADLTLNNAHFTSTQTNQPTPTAGSPGTPLNCGTSPSSVVKSGSTDSAGAVEIVSGTGTPDNTWKCTTTVTFNKAYSSAPKAILFTPEKVDGGNGSSAGRHPYVTNVTTTSFTFEINIAPAASEADWWYYWVIE